MCAENLNRASAWTQASPIAHPHCLNVPTCALPSNNLMWFGENMGQGTKFPRGILGIVNLFIVGRRGFSNMTERRALPVGLSAIELETPVVFVGFSIKEVLPKRTWCFPPSLSIRQSRSASHTADKHLE